MRSLCLAAALTICAWANPAFADHGDSFIRHTCAGSIRFFRAELLGLNNIGEIYLLEDADRKRAADVLAREAQLYLLDLPATITCRFHDGTRIRLESYPNSGNERHLFPGSRIRLTINGKTVLDNVGFDTDCDRSIVGISIDPGSEPEGTGEVEVTMEPSSVRGPLSPDDPLSKLPTTLTLKFTTVDATSYDTKSDPMSIRNCYN